MTFQEAITNARSELGDTYEGSYAYQDADMMRYAIQGVREAWRVRPSLQYDESTGYLYDLSTVLPISTDDLYYDIPLPHETQYALEFYIVYACLSRDVTDEGNIATSNIAKERFDKIILG